MLFTFLSVLTLVLSLGICSVFFLQRKFTITLSILSFLLWMVSLWLWMNYLMEFHPIK